MICCCFVVYYKLFFFNQGEHIKNWRQRYFLLFEDGSLKGFKNKPQNDTLSDPLNNFTVRGCQILKIERPKPCSFIIRGLQWTTVIERMFHVETDKERDEWCDAITLVAGRLCVEEDQDVEMVDANRTQDDYRSRLHISTSSGSRGRKIVINLLL